ncbi:MAG: (2Fe-2S)-binding protein [Caulobacteraceae bacterium]
MRLDLSVNGTRRALDVAQQASLLHVLRNHLGLRAARLGCGAEDCGCCRVLVDGAPVFSCTLPAASVAQHEVTTAEGLEALPEGRAVVGALLAEQAGQCGWCLSGIAVAATALIADDPAPARDAILAALEPHLCRCGVHARVVRAVERAARELAASRP